MHLKHVLVNTINDYTFDSNGINKYIPMTKTINVPFPIHIKSHQRYKNFIHVKANFPRIFQQYICYS